MDSENPFTGQTRKDLLPKSLQKRRKLCFPEPVNPEKKEVLTEYTAKRSAAGMKIESNQGMAYRPQVNENNFNWREANPIQKETTLQKSANNLAKCNAEHVQRIYWFWRGRRRQSVTSCTEKEPSRT